ncbi:mucin-binding protein, partial [Limosilactobacillus equigenerosi]|uniref:mucin-binding protein n=1 Tax=Limosilactobacillus equigenerosi TaxID=417373 RepID=UPI0012E35049
MMNITESAHADVASSVNTTEATTALVNHTGDNNRTTQPVVLNGSIGRKNSTNVLPNAALSVARDSNSISDIKQIKVTRDLTRHIEYKENKDKLKIADPNGVNRNLVANLPDMDQSKLKGDKPTQQTVTLVGVGYLNVTTGRLVTIKTDAQGHAIDKDGNLIATDSDGNAVIGQINSDGSLTPKLNSYGTVIRTKYVAEENADHTEKQGGFHWSIPVGAKFGSFPIPTADHYISNPMVAPEQDIKTWETNVEGITDAFGKSITNPTVKQIIDFVNQHTDSTINSTIEDVSNYPKIPTAIVPNTQYIFDQYQLVDSYGRAMPYICTLAVDRDDPTGGIYLYVTSPDYKNIYWSTMQNDGGNATQVGGKTGYTISNLGRVDIRNFGDNYGNSISINVSSSSNLQLRRIFGYGAIDGRLSTVFGNYKPREVTQVISIVDENGDEIKGYPPVKVQALTGQHFTVNIEAPKIVGYALNPEDETKVSGSISDYQVGQTYTRSWYDQSLEITITENFKVLNSNGDVSANVYYYDRYNNRTQLLNGTVIKANGFAPTPWIGNIRFNIQNPWIAPTTNLTLHYNKIAIGASHDPLYVVYTPKDAATAVVNFIDDSDNQKKLSNVSLPGETGDEINFKPATDLLAKYENNGYELVSSEIPIERTTYDFESDNNQVTQIYNVHLKHGEETVTPDNPHHPGDPI